MTIPEFTNHGLLPVGIHDCNIADVEAYFCGNDHRRDIWARFLDFLAWVETMPKPSAILIDGSFVTDKALPSDVDVVVDISTCDTRDQNTWFGAHAREHGAHKANHKTDFYPYVKGVSNEFGLFFQYVRVSEALERGVSAEQRKGILRMQL